MILLLAVCNKASHDVHVCTKRDHYTYCEQDFDKAVVLCISLSEIKACRALYKKYLPITHIIYLWMFLSKLRQGCGKCRIPYHSDLGDEMIGHHNHTAPTTTGTNGFEAERMNWPYIAAPCKRQGVWFRRLICDRLSGLVKRTTRRTIRSTLLALCRERKGDPLTAIFRHVDTVVMSGSLR